MFHVPVPDVPRTMTLVQSLQPQPNPVDPAHQNIEAQHDVDFSGEQTAAGGSGDVEMGVASST